MKRSGRNHPLELKAKVAFQAIRGDKTLAELAQQHQIHPNQITTWKQQLLEHAREVFANGHAAGATDSERRIQELHTKIGELTWNAIFCPTRSSASRCERESMIDRDTTMPIVSQWEALDLSRLSVYYQPRPLPEADLALMRRIDEPRTSPKCCNPRASRPAWTARAVGSTMCSSSGCGGA